MYFFNLLQNRKIFLLGLCIIIFGIIYLVNVNNEEVENPRGYYLKVGDTNYDGIYKLAKQGYIGK